MVNAALASGETLELDKVLQIAESCMNPDDKVGCVAGIQRDRGWPALQLPLGEEEADSLSTVRTLKQCSVYWEAPAGTVHPELFPAGSAPVLT